MIVGLIRTQVSLGEIVLVASLLIGGLVAWRTRSGVFYKQLSEERLAEVSVVKTELKALRAATDIRPVLELQRQTVEAVHALTVLIGETAEKVKDLNGSLRAHSEAMKALADRLIVDEATRALLSQTAQRRRPHPRPEKET